jgi:hypothetical protein
MIFRVSGTGLATSGLKTIISGHFACYTDIKKNVYISAREENIRSEQREKSLVNNICEI